MAQTLGEAELLLSVDASRLTAGLNQAQQQARKAGDEIGEAFTKPGKKIETAANGLQYFIDAQGRARQLNGRFVTDAERAAAGIKNIGEQSRRAGAAVTDSFNRPGRTFGALANTLDGINSRLERLRRLRNAEIIGSQQFKNVTREIERLERALDRVEGKGKDGGLIGSLVGFVSVGAAVAGLKTAVSAAAELEAVTRRLQNTLGAQGAQGALGFLRGISSDLGLNFRSLAEGFSSFTAAASAAGVPLEQQKELFTAVARSGQALGLSNDAINGSLLALQQVAAKGTVQMEELRGQLGERLPIAFAATARGLGISNAELIKLVESGKLSADQFFPALTKGLNELNSGTRGVPTATQNFQRLTNAIQELQTRVGNFFLPGASGIAAALSQGIEGALTKLDAINLSQAFGFKTEDALGLVGYLGRVRQEFGLTEQQAKNLVSDALKAVEPSRNFFGGLELSGQQLADIMGVIRTRAQEFTAESRAAREETDRQNAARKAGAEELARLEKERVEDAKRLAETRQQELRALERIRQSAQALRGAREGFASAVGQQFNIATNQQRQRAREILEQQVRAAERARAFDPSRVSARFGVPQTAGGLDLSQLTFRQLERLAQQTGTLANAEATLQGAVTENTKALQALAARRWEVQVNVRNNTNGATTVDYQNALR